MSTTQTKAALVAELEALHASYTALGIQATNDNEALNAEIAMLRAKCEALRAQNLQLSAELTNVCDVASAVNKATARPAYAMPAWQIERQRQMEAAKAAAMAHHCVVKV